MILFWNSLSYHFLEAAGMSLLETKRIALCLLVLLHHFMFSIIRRLHGAAVPLLSSFIPRFHERTIGSWASRLNSLDEHKYQSDFTKKSQAPTMFPSSSLFWAFLAVPDPPWTIASSQKPFVARRILMFRVILSPILVPCQARESTTAARRILVISPESSHRRYDAVLVFARARMCGHLPLFTLSMSRILQG